MEFSLVLVQRNEHLLYGIFVSPHGGLNMDAVYQSEILIYIYQTRGCYNIEGHGMNLVKDREHPAESRWFSVCDEPARRITLVCDILR
jgi:hypothetical protein